MSAKLKIVFDLNDILQIRFLSTDVENVKLLLDLSWKLLMFNKMPGLAKKSGSSQRAQNSAKIWGFSDSLLA